MVSYLWELYITLRHCFVRNKKINLKKRYRNCITATRSCPEMKCTQHVLVCLFSGWCFWGFATHLTHTIWPSVYGHLITTSSAKTYLKLLQSHQAGIFQYHLTFCCIYYELNSFSKIMKTGTLILTTETLKKQKNMDNANALCKKVKLLYIFIVSSAVFFLFV